MSFRLIKGKFAARLGRPDGDSVRFIPNEPSLLKGLKGRNVRIYTNQGVRSVQLRYEGIDTLEKGAIKPFSSDATRENMLAIGGTGSTTQDDTLGFILTRRIGPHRRPICFVCAGTTNKDEGTEVFVNETWLRRTVNYHLIRNGFAYPMFYNTLFAELRNVLIEGLNLARSEQKGVWPADRTQQGVTYSGPDCLKGLPPIFPKLWRRLRKYRKPNLDGFLKFIRSTEEHLTTMSDDRDLQFEDIIKVSGNKVRLTYPPEHLKFRSQGT